MKSQKGITLISLTIYVIAMSIVVGIMAVISSYFYKNIDTTSKNVEPLVEYTKFNSFFTEEINNNGVKVLECKEDYIVFDNGSQYSFVKENKGIYKNQVKICREVENCTFTYKKENGEKILVVTITMVNSQPKTIEYRLKN